MWILIGAAAALAALAAAWHWTPLADYLSAHEIRGWARALRRDPWAPAALVLAYTPASLVMFPTPLLTLFAVIAFGAWAGGSYALGGIMLSACALYAIGRFVRYERLRKFASRRGVDTARDLAREHGILTVIAANLMPVPPFGVQCIAAGAVRMKFWEFALGNLISRAPGVIVAALFARELLAALDDESVNYWLLVPAVLAFIAFWYFGRRWALQHQRRRRPRR